jgi:excisionase family DNA binding protein
MNSSDHPPVLSTDAILTPEEAADYLRVNPQTVYRRLRAGSLPGAKVGHQWRIRKVDLDSLLAGSRHNTQTSGR